MQSIFQILYKTLQANADAVLCVIIETSGVVSRGPGSMMLLAQNGETAGSVGGGAAEAHALAQCRQVLDRQHDFSDAFDPSTPGDGGALCGDGMRFVYLYFSPRDARRIELLDAVIGLEEGHAEGHLLCEIGQNMRLALFDREHGLRFGDQISVPSEAFVERPMLLKGDCEIFLCPITSSERVFLFGCGHVGRALCHLLSFLEFRVTAIDERTELLDPALLPDAEARIPGNYQDIFSCAQPGPRDYAVVMTHAHTYDFQIIGQLLRTDVRYIACLGSRSKAAACRQTLAEAGFSPEDIARVHCPAGIRIGGKLPAEVALSIAAQMVALRSDTPCE